MTFKHSFGFLTSIAAEIGVQQIDHGPKVATFLNVNLKDIAEVVERGTSLAKQALLFDRSRLGVTLGYDQTA